MATADLYTSFFGLSERPFTLLPDPDFLFWSKTHKRAFSVLEYGVLTHSPLTVITGDVGTGKTTLVRHLLGQLENDTTVGLISNAQGTRGELLRWVLNALEIDHAATDDYVTIFQKFQDFVVGEYAQNRHVILILDEAQNLPIDALEELRMLTNINSGKDELLQLILVGQPELRDIISRPELSQFAQRVSATYHMKPMALDTTIAYIQHRLRHVGGSGEEFSETAMQRVYQETGGVPRLINKLCDLAMVYAASDGWRVVGHELINELIEDDLFINTDKQPPFLLTNRTDIPEAAE